MKKGIILAMVTSLMLISCNGIKKDELSMQNNAKLKMIIDDKIGEIEAKLYFDGTNDEKNPQIAEQTLYINGEELIGQYLMQALIQGPDIKGSAKAILPKNTKLISFTIKDDVAIINLSKDAIVPMNVAKEKACLESILYTISQLSSVNKINIIVENQMIDSLGGNFDISKPFGKEDLNGLKKQ
ncbi:MAG: GerMN domain-containing protein [Sarcina sp.]